MIKEGKVVIAGDVRLTSKLVSKVFKIPYLSMPAKGRKVTDSQMKGEFGNPIGAKLYYMVRNASGIRAANLLWYLEKVYILQKTAYMSKEDFTPLYQAERGIKVDWATVLYDRMQLTGKRDWRRTPAMGRVAPYLAAIIEHVLKVTPVASGMKTPAANMLMEEGTVSGSKRRKLLLRSPTIDVKSPFKVTWKDLEDPDSKVNFFSMGLELKKSESREGSSANHGAMGIFSVEEATNYLIDLGKFLQSQYEVLWVLENVKQEHKCNVFSEGEMQKISMQLLQEKSDKEKLQEEVARLTVEVDEQSKELDEKVAAVTTENVLLINRLSPLAELEKIENERLVVEMKEMRNNRKEIEDNLSKLKAKLSSGLLEPDWNLVAKAKSDGEKQADPDFVVEKAVEPDAEGDIGEQST
ncbi:hypothetical protein L7F22_034612 [Adiantum nelumboides]|nr:hypothetical protein [Adiantum nelumboides]